MAKNSTKYKSSAANAEAPSTVPLEDTATMSGAPDAVSDAAGDPNSSAAIHTPQSESGVAASEASAELVKPKPLTGSEPIEAVVAETDAPTVVSTSPEVEATASGTNSEPSEGAADGIGANAGPTLADALALSGCADFDNLVDMAKVGVSLMDAIDIYVNLDGPLKGWSPAEDPAEIVGDLYDMLESGGAIAKSNGIDLTPAPDSSVTSIASVDDGGKPAAHSIRVKSARDGFRRAGITHSREGRIFAFDELTEDQLEVLLADPSITVEYL